MKENGKSLKFGKRGVRSMKKRIISAVLCFGFLFSAFGVVTPVSAESAQWTYYFTLKVADKKGAGVSKNGVFGTIDFYLDGQKEYESVKIKVGKIGRNNSKTYEYESGYAPWNIAYVGINNECDDALCVQYIKLEVSQKGRSQKFTVLDKYNPKPKVMEKWIETQKGSGYDKEFFRCVYSITDRNIEKLDNFDSFSETAILDVNEDYKNDAVFKKNWSGIVTDQYKKNSIVSNTFSCFTATDPPKMTFEVSGIAADKKTSATLANLEKGGIFKKLKNNDYVCGYEINKRSLMSYMNSNAINMLTVKTKLSFPYSNTAYPLNYYKTLTIVRNAFAVSDLTYMNAAYSLNSDNNYYNTGSDKIVVRGVIKTGKNNNHLSKESLNSKYVRFTNAKLQIGSGTVFLTASEKSASIDSSGRFSIEFALPKGLDSMDVGCTLMLEGAYIDLENDMYLCEECTDYQVVSDKKPGDCSVFGIGAKYKVDTIMPEVTITPTDGKPITDWRKTITVNSVVSESINILGSTSDIDRNQYQYSLDNGKKLVISNKNGGGSGALIQVAPAAAGSPTEITIALTEESEIEGTLEIYGQDIAGNAFTQKIEGIKLDNKAPCAAVTAKESERLSDGSKNISYSFDISDASGTGRVYYCFVEGAPQNLPEQTEERVSGEVLALIGQWAYVEQGNATTAVLRRARGEHFKGQLCYYTVDAFSNKSDITRIDVSLLNEDSTCEITALNADTSFPQKDYDISVKAHESNTVMYRWMNVDNGGYVASYRQYKAGDAIGSGVQKDNNGADVSMNGKYRLLCEVKTPTGETSVSSRDFVFDNAKPEISYTARNSGSYKEAQSISVRATDASGIKEAYAKIVNNDGTDIDGMTEFALNIADGIAASEVAVSGVESGVYAIKVRAVDYNGYESERQSNPIYIRNTPPTVKLEAESEKTYADAPIFPDDNYVIKMKVSEEFVGAESLFENNEPKQSVPQQTLYYRISDGSNEYGPWISAGVMKLEADGYRLETQLERPASLTEGENIISIQTVITASDAMPSYNAAIVSEDRIILYCDTTPPQYKLNISEYRTNGSIIGSVVLFDNFDSAPTLTAENSAIVSVSAKQPSILESDALAEEFVAQNTFEIEVKGNTVQNLKATDNVGNEVLIPIVITMIDKEAPTAAMIRKTDISKGERTDVEAVIEINGMESQNIQIAVIPQSTSIEGGTSELNSDGKINDEFFDYDTGLIKVSRLNEADSGYADQVNAQYTVSMSGITGTYKIGVRTADSLGNTADIVLEELLMPVDAQASSPSISVSPQEAGEKAVVNARFNVPVSVLPQNLIVSEGDEEMSAEEINLDNAAKYAGIFSEEVSFIISQIGTYKLYTADDLGRTYVFEAEVTDEMVSFGQFSDVTANTCVSGFYYDENDEVVSLGSRYLTSGETAAPSAGYMLEPTATGYRYDFLDTTVEVTAAQDLYMWPESMETVVDGLIFNSYLSAEYYVSGPDDVPVGYTKLIYNTEEIVENYTNSFGDLEARAADQNDRILNVYVYNEDSAYDNSLWTLNTLVIDNIDNTAPYLDAQFNPLVQRDMSGNPMSFTLGNVTSKITMQDPDSGICYVNVYAQGPDEGKFDCFIPLIDESGNPIDYSETPFTETNEYISVTFSGDTDLNGTKQMEVIFFKNVMGVISVYNTGGNVGYLHGETDFSIDYINKTQLSDADYTLSYYYEDSEGQWQQASDSTYYKKAKAVILPTESGIARGLYAENNGRSLEKTLSSFDSSFTFELKDKYGYTIDVLAELDNFDETPGKIEYEFDAEKKTFEPVEITITVSDAESGVGSVTLAHGADSIALTDKGGGKFSGLLSRTGSHIITLLDNVGNKTQKTFTVSNIDTTLPLLSGIEYNINPEVKTSRLVSAKLTYSKPNVTLSSVQVSSGLSGDGYKVDYNNSIIRFFENGSLSVYFTDEYGNVGSDIVTVDNIYKTPPAVSAVVTPAANLMTVDVTFEKAIDSATQRPIDSVRKLSDIMVSYGGIAGYIEQGEDNEKMKFTLCENGSYTFKVYDAEGLTSYVTVSISEIDKSAPKITQFRWSYDYDVLENGQWIKKTESGTHIVGDEAGYILADDVYNVTNKDVSVTVTSDSETTVVGSGTDASTEHSLIYPSNGMYIFNLAKPNGLMSSYGVGIEMIDKTPPVIELSAPELVFFENSSVGTGYSKDMLEKPGEAFECYDMWGGKKDLSDNVLIDYGSFNPNDIFANKFDRSAPFTITYTVSDDAHNETVVKRSVRLVGLFDTIALINGEYPDAYGRGEIDTDKISLQLQNFSGISYARVEKGVKTMGQMKKLGTVIPETSQGSGLFEYTAPSNGWYTVLIQTDKRDYFNLQIYVLK